MLHNILGDLLRSSEFNELLTAIRSVCAMFRTSHLRWQELKAIQAELIASKNKEQNASDIPEEDERDVDDDGEDISEELGGQDKILRVKIDQATRW